MYTYLVKGECTYELSINPQCSIFHVNKDINDVRKIFDKRFIHSINGYIGDPRDMIDAMCDHPDCTLIVKTIFPNYEEDIEYGGNKLLIKIAKNQFDMGIYYIKNKQISYINLNNCRSTYKVFAQIAFKHFLYGQIYNLHDPELLKLLNKDKHQIKIEKIADFVKMHNILYTRRQYILAVFTHNSIINDCVYCTIICVNKCVNVNIGVECYKAVKLYRLGNVYYDHIWLLKNTPCTIEYGENIYFYRNIYGEYIGGLDHEPKFVFYITLFEYGNAPWITKYDAYKNLLEKIKTEKNLTICGNKQYIEI